MGKRWIYLVTILLLASFLLLPSLGDPLHYGDECIYLTIGNALRQGKILYRDIHDNKPPIIYILAALSSGHLAIFRFFGFLSVISQLIILYFFSISISKNSTVAFLLQIPAILLVVIFEGRVANGEVFMMLPIVLSAFLLWSWRRRLNAKHGLIIGLLFAWGFLVKAPAAFDAMGILLAVFVFLAKPPRPWRRISFWAITGAATIPIILSLGYFAIRGGVVYYVRSALLQNIGYVSSWSGNGGDHALFLRALILASLTLTIWFWHRFLSPSLIFASCWFIFALFGALLSGRPYPHYLFEVIPSLIILHAAAYVQLRRRHSSFLAIPLLADSILIAVYLSFHFWWYPQISYYRHFATYLQGRTTKAQYYQYWGKRSVANYQLAKFVRQTVPDKQPIFVWGDAACIYALSGHSPVGRYTVNYHIYDYNGFSSVLRSLEKEKPVLIIKLANEKHRWPELDSLLSKYYYRLHYPRLPDIIFRRRPTSWQKLSLGFH